MIDDLKLQSEYCEKTSPLYAALFEALAAFSQANEAGNADIALNGYFNTIDTCWRHRQFLAFFERPILLAGAIHQQVLQGKAPELAPFYASCGGAFEASKANDLAKAIKTTLSQRHRAMIPFLSQDTIQTNETSRGLAWLLPVLSHWQKKRPAVTLIELGCSAGLGLVADHYGYQVVGPTGQEWSQAGCPHFDIKVIENGADRAFSSLNQLAEFRAAIKTRIGCDLNPLDCRKNDQKRILEALIWPDNVPRLARLRAAMKTQTQHDVRYECGDMVECINRLAAESFADTPMVCLFNTVATCYLDDPHYARLRAAIAAVFHGPWADKHCLWVEFEMSRTNEVLPDHALMKEQLIKVHSPAVQGGLHTDYIGAATAHPKEIEIF